MSDDHKPTAADAQVARLTELRLRDLIRLSEMGVPFEPDQGDLANPLHQADSVYDWHNHVHHCQWINDDRPELLVAFSLWWDLALCWARYDGIHRVGMGTVPFRRVGDKCPLRAQVDAVRDSLGWLRGWHQQQDTGCEGAA